MNIFSFSPILDTRKTLPHHANMHPGHALFCSKHLQRACCMNETACAGGGVNNWRIFTWGNTHTKGY